MTSFSIFESCHNCLRLIYLFINLSNWNSHTKVEITGIYFIHGFVNRRSLKARRLYSKRFPKRHVPDRETFKTIREMANALNVSNRTE